MVQEILSGKVVSLQSGHQPQFSYGPDASKPTNPQPGDTHYATDTQIGYKCFVAGTWVQDVSTLGLKIVAVTVLSDQLSGFVAHGMSGTPKVGKPNPNRLDNTGNAYASADATNITVTCEVPVSNNTTFYVPAVL